MSERKLQTHQLKTWPEPFQALWEGTKFHELRKDDRGYVVGDWLVLNEWDPETQRYSGRSVRAVVTYITRNVQGWGLAPGFCIMSLGILRRMQE